MIRFLTILIGGLLALLIFFTTLWASGALWYRLPAEVDVRFIASLAFFLLGLGVIIAMTQGRIVLPLILYAAAIFGVSSWWNTIEPRAHGDFAPDVARQTTGKIEGDTLTLFNVRNFDWRSDKDFTERWETRTYDLKKLKTLDMFWSYWSGPFIAHSMFSFGFEDGQFITWSNEVKRSKGGEYSPVADFFKNDPLVSLAVDERDVVRVRTDVRNEDVQLYRTNVDPSTARAMLVEYVNEANKLAERPEFYNSLTTNCTTSVYKMMRAIGLATPMDWRLVLNGYFPNMAYDYGILDTRYAFAALRTASHIDQRARIAGASPNYSDIVRFGVPSPLEPMVQPANKPLQTPIPSAPIIPPSKPSMQKLNR